MVRNRHTRAARHVEGGCVLGDVDGGGGQRLGFGPAQERRGGSYRGGVEMIEPPQPDSSSQGQSAIGLATGKQFRNGLLRSWQAWSCAGQTGGGIGRGDGVYHGSAGVDTNRGQRLRSDQPQVKSVGYGQVE